MQSRLFSQGFFVNFLIKLFALLILCDLVHDVENIFHLCLTVLTANTHSGNLF